MQYIPTREHGQGMPTRDSDITQMQLGHPCPNGRQCSYMPYLEQSWAWRCGQCMIPPTSHGTPWHDQTTQRTHKIAREK